MAGFAGIFNFHDRDSLPDLIEKMIQEITFIPEDTYGKVITGNSAFGLVGHGISVASNQPFYTPDKQSLAFMDGEVYEVGNDGDGPVQEDSRHKDILNSVVHTFMQTLPGQEYAFCRKLNGNFLLLGYNKKDKRLVLANDRYASIPIFYTWCGKALIFSTHLKAILRISSVHRAIDELAVLEFFHFQRIFEDKTYIDQVKVLKPGCVLTACDGSVKIEQYFTPDYRLNRKESLRSSAATFERTLEASVKMRTREDIQYGLLLSGGLDARAVLAMLHNPIKTFTIGDFENKEVETARKIAATCNCDHIFLKRDKDHYIDIVEKAVDLGAGMYSFQHAHFLNFLDPIRGACDVLLHGYGFDTFFKGEYIPKKIVRLLGKTTQLPLMNDISERELLDEVFNLSYCIDKTTIRRLFQPDFLAAYYPRLESAINDILNQCQAEKSYQKLDYFTVGFPSRHFTYLNNLCLQNYSLSRMIAFDNDLFDIHFRMPAENQICARAFKVALKNANPRLAKIANANTGLPATASPSFESLHGIYVKAKNRLVPRSGIDPLHTQGSWSNFKNLIKDNPKMLNLYLDVVHDPGCIDGRMFNKDYLVRLLEGYQSGTDRFSWIFYLIITYGLWHRKYAVR